MSLLLLARQLRFAQTLARGRTQHRPRRRLGRHPGRSGAGASPDDHPHHPAPPGRALSSRAPIRRQYLRNLQKWSRETKHWLDIPYHYIIDLDGKIYEGRKIDYAGDTNTEYDPTGHALIEVVGNFEEVEPNRQQLRCGGSADGAAGAVSTMWPLDHIASHRDFSTQTVCPGANLYRYVQDGYFRHKVALRLAQAQAEAATPTL